MDLDEAILQMDLLGHDFFIYTDVEDNTNECYLSSWKMDIGLLEVNNVKELSNLMVFCLVGKARLFTSKNVYK